MVVKHGGCFLPVRRPNTSIVIFSLASKGIAITVIHLLVLIKISLVGIFCIEIHYSLKLTLLFLFSHKIDAGSEFKPDNVFFRSNSCEKICYIANKLID